MKTTDALLVSRARTAIATGDAARIRKTAHLSQAEIAAAIGVTPAAVSRWEGGSRVPRGQAAKRYAKVLHALEPSGSR